MKRTGTIILFLLFISLLNAQEKNDKQQLIEMRGYIKEMAGVGFSKGFDSSSFVNLIHNRLNFLFNFSEKIKGRVEVRNRIFSGNQLKQIPDFGKIINRYNGIADLSKLWVNNKNLVFHSVIDRFLLQYRDEKWDITAGRQRINWGINNTWNPNDIFNAYNFLDFDYEERPGNDAIRIQRFLNNNRFLDLAYKQGKHKNETIAAILYRFNKKKYDYQFITGFYNTDLVIGGGWAGSIKETGFKGEISYFHPRKNFTDTTGVISFSVMADKTFKNEWYVSFSALFNSNPSNSILNSGSIYSSDLSAKSLFPFRYSFFTGLVKSISPITSVNTSIIYSPKNNSLIIFPSFQWNAWENIDIDFTIQSFWGKEGEGYKSLGAAFFLRGKISF